MNWITFAWRNLWRNPRRTILTMLTVGVTAFAAAVALGYILATFNAVREGTILGSVGHLQVLHRGYLDKIGERPLQYGLTADEGARAQRAIASLHDVRSVARQIDFEGLVSNGDLSYGFVGDGIEPDKQAPDYFDYHTVVAGRYIDPTKTGTEIVVGAELARKLAIKPGDVISLMVSTASGGINATDAQVVGIISTGVKDLDDRIVQTSFGAAQKLLRTDKASRIVVLLNRTSSTEAAAASLRGALPDLDVRTWDQIASLYHQLVSLYRNEFSVLGTILAVTILLSMANSIVMSVMERQREISTLRALGISTGIVKFMFVNESVFTSAIGAAVGACLGALVMGAVNYAHLRLPPPPGRVKPVLLEFALSVHASVGIEIAFIVLGVLAAAFATRRLLKRNILEGFSA
ncbi:ABC transporter permease [Trinickia sp. EG282A]|uniref:ABC transporter permease n=1 Tax=Trinickia sp. EG282A TaxID=3237013 RepID=UPI0034D293E6